jgi:hypothetical protein
MEGMEAKEEMEGTVFWIIIVVLVVKEEMEEMAGRQF